MTCFCFENLPSKYIGTINNILTQPLIITLTWFDRLDLTEQNVNKTIFWKFETWVLTNYLSFDKVWLLKITLFFAVPCEIICDWDLKKDVSIKFQCIFSIFTFYQWVFWQTCWFLLNTAVYVTLVLFFDVKLPWFSSTLCQK